jgi:hypothetical protein
MTPTNELPTRLREFNRWRRGGEGIQPNPSKIGAMIDEAADRLEEMERELAAEREQVAILRSDEKRLVQFAKTYRLRADETEAKLEQERQDRKQADLDTIRALGERNDARAIIDATLKALPVGYIPAHTPESLPGRVADLVSELAAWKHELKQREP